jgi:hypothetical protein
MDAADTKVRQLAMNTTTSTTNLPHVPLPPGTQTYTGWESDSNGTSRIIWGDARTVEATGITLQAHAVQLADGSIDVNTESVVTGQASRSTRSTATTLGTACT